MSLLADRVGVLFFEALVADGDKGNAAGASDKTSSFNQAAKRLDENGNTLDAKGAKGAKGVKGTKGPRPVLREANAANSAKGAKRGCENAPGGACCKKADVEAGLWRMRAEVARALQAEAEERVEGVRGREEQRAAAREREREVEVESEKGRIVAALGEARDATVARLEEEKNAAVERLEEERNAAVERLQGDVMVERAAVARLEAEMGAAISGLDAEVAELRDECQRKDMEIASMAEVVVQAAVGAEAKLLGASAGHSVVVARLEADFARVNADLERVNEDLERATVALGDEAAERALDADRLGADLALQVALNEQAHADEVAAAEKVECLKAELVERDAATQDEVLQLTTCVVAREADLEAMAGVVAEAADEIQALDWAVAEKEGRIEAMERVVEDERRRAAQRVGVVEAEIEAVRVRGKVEVERLEARVRALGREVDGLGEGLRRAEGRAEVAEAALAKEAACAVSAREAAEALRVRVVAMEECRRDSREKAGAMQAELGEMAAAAREIKSGHEVAVEALESRVQALRSEVAGRGEAIRLAQRKTKLAEEALAKEATRAATAFEGVEKMRVRVLGLEKSLCDAREQASVTEKDYKKEAATVRDLRKSKEMKVRALETKIVALGGELLVRKNAIRLARQKVTLAEASLATEAAGAESARKAVEEMRARLAVMEESQLESGNKASAAEAELEKMAAEVRERRRCDEAKAGDLKRKVQSLGSELAGREDALRLAVQRSTMAEASLATEAASAESARATAEEMRARVVETNKRSEEVSVRVIAMERKLEDVAQLSKVQLGAAQAEIARLSAAAAAAESSKADSFDEASGTAAEMARLCLEVERSERSASQAQADAATLSEQLLSVTNDLETRAAQNESLRAELQSLNMRLRRMDVMSLPAGAAELLAESGDSDSANVLGLLSDEERKSRRSGMRGDKATAKMLSIRIAEERASRRGAGAVLESVGGRENKPESRAE